MQAEIVESASQLVSPDYADLPWVSLPQVEHSIYYVREHLYVVIPTNVRDQVAASEMVSLHTQYLLRKRALLGSNAY